MNEPGRPSYTDNDYVGWLDEMTSYLKQGHSLNYAIFHAGLEKHETTIREKYRLGDWFSRKIDNLQSFLGGLLNNVFYNELMEAVDAQKQGRALSQEQWKNLRFLAEKHISASKYFVSRQEIAVRKTDPEDIGKILDELNNDVEKGHNELAEAAKMEIERLNMEKQITEDQSNLPQ